jgi:signal peptidase II
MSDPQSKVIGFFLLAILVISLDQLFKFVAPEYLTVERNTGIIFGLFPQISFYLVLVGVGLLSAVIFKNTLNSASALLLGGAISNLIDRLRFGYVVDYIEISSLPVFNLADVAIILGAVLLLVTAFRKEKKYGR